LNATNHYILGAHEDPTHALRMGGAVQGLQRVAGHTPGTRGAKELYPG